MSSLVNSSASWRLVEKRRERKNGCWLLVTTKKTGDGNLQSSWGRLVDWQKFCFEPKPNIKVSEYVRIALKKTILCPCFRYFSATRFPPGCGWFSQLLLLRTDEFWSILNCPNWTSWSPGPGALLHEKFSSFQTKILRNSGDRNAHWNAVHHLPRKERLTLEFLKTFVEGCRRTFFRETALKDPDWKEICWTKFGCIGVKGSCCIFLYESHPCSPWS